MSEPDDVERLVGRIEAEARAEVADPEDVVSGEDVLRLARIVRELLAEFPIAECRRRETLSTRVARCTESRPAEQDTWCRPCRARALRERLCRIARGEA